MALESDVTLYLSLLQHRMNDMSQARISIRTEIRRRQRDRRCSGPKTFSPLCPDITRTCQTTTKPRTWQWQWNMHHRLGQEEEEFHKFDNNTMPSNLA